MIKKSIEVLAPAKINLSLCIIQKRDDGYHDLETVMTKIDLLDRLTLSTCAKGIHLNLVAKGDGQRRYNVPSDDSNIVCKAATAFFSFLNLPPQLEIALEKNIPVAAGLGGGSSDAAAVLRGLSTLFPEKVSAGKLLDIAAGLGADVPFFMQDAGTVFARGRGDVCEAVTPLTGCSVLLVNPGIAVSTKWAYESFALTSRENTYTLAREFVRKTGVLCLDTMEQDVAERHSRLWLNDLESVTEKAYPEITRLKQKLLACGADRAMMSGSGSTVFGIFSDASDCAKCFSACRQQYPDTFVCRPCV